MKTETALAILCYLSKVSSTKHGLAHYSSNGHKAMVSNHQKSENKWIIFPDQQDLHSKSKLSETSVIENSALVDSSSFFEIHGKALGLDSYNEMRLVKHWQLKGTSTKHEKYYQYVNDIRVFGGEFIVTIGSHGGVLNAHGLPLKMDTTHLRSMNTHAVHKTIDHLSVLTAVESYISATHSMRIHVDRSHPIEVVWLMSGLGSKTSSDSKPTLAYYLKSVTSQQPYLSFDALVSVETKEVELFIDKSNEYTSPFASPIDYADIYVYDQWRKDLDDDQADDYYSYDEDRFSAQTLVFDTPSGDYVYPTGNEEMDVLIDNTLYVKNLFNSLTNGEYLSWNKVENALNIEFNLSISNANFDGTWGIHFGTGYITDDVISHEWAHGYTQTLNGLIYMGESGAMNEAYSDIFGETIDILNEDTPDSVTLRTQWPLECTATLPDDNGEAAGSDSGHRWSMGEDVISDYPDGSLRDMYYPECFFNPSSTDAPYYICCNSEADGGGVHQNSGVLNRLFAVLTDGGAYADPSNPNELVTIAGLGITKTSNLFLRTAAQLTEMSQFYDFAVTCANVCRENVGDDLYDPNLLDDVITVVSAKLTSADCDTVDAALAASGMASTEDFCPNLDCQTATYNCGWKKCPASDNVAKYEPYDDTMEALVLPACFSGTATYARAFAQSEFPANDFQLTCTQISFYELGTNELTVTIYIDSNGGEPDYDHMDEQYSYTTSAPNAGGGIQVIQLDSMDIDNTPAISFKDYSSDATLVVVMSVPAQDYGFTYGGGQVNVDVRNDPLGQTYVGGSCTDGFVSHYDYVVNSGVSSWDGFKDSQWYVRIHSDTYSDSNSDSSDGGQLSKGAVAGISIAVILVGGGLCACIGYLVFSKFIRPDEKALMSSTNSRIQL